MEESAIRFQVSDLQMILFVTDISLDLRLYGSLALPVISQNKRGDGMTQ